jgi:tetratricopeptide (TPR) repeat protein
MKRNPLSPVLSLVLATALAAAACGPAGNSGGSTVVEKREIVRTYPFSDPDPVPIFARSSMGGQGTRLYPYYIFDGFAARAEDRDWTVVRLENPHLSVAVLPEVGGKVWGATEKATGREFLYTNHVLKFRQIALRGPWTSGGIEFNFGVVGHAPTTATPVDYLTLKNPDGSAGVVVGALDLPSRTRWSVTVTLPKDAAHFETNARWANPTPFDQSYYAWSCAAIRTADDLRYIFPGRYYIGHDYAVPFEPWPVDRGGRDLSIYRNNASPGSKSYFTVGDYDDFYGAWYETSDSGFGHWARPDEVPGRKVWIWDLSRQGGIWVDLLTDKDGQYTEPQAGRLYNQSDHESFPPGRIDQWRELWFPYRDIGPMVKASPWAVLGAKSAAGRTALGLYALKPLDEEVLITAEGREILREKIALATGKVWRRDVAFAAGAPFKVAVGDKLAYDSDPASRRLERPLRFRNAEEQTTEGLFLSAGRLEKERQYGPALEKYEAVAAREPLHVRALSRIAGLRARRGEDEKSLEFSGRALNVAMYDPEANYFYGVAARRLGRYADARETFGWAARSGEFRAAALTQLAEIALREKDVSSAIEYARKALAAGPEHSAAWEVLAAALRRSGRKAEAEAACRSVLAFDPLDHLARFEIYLAEPTAAKLAAFKAPIRGELPHETFLETAMFYIRNGLVEDALTLLRNAPEQAEVILWTAYLLKDGSPEESRAALDQAFALSPRLVFPFREESIPVYRWAMDRRPSDWKPRYYLGLIFWGKGRMEEAESLFDRCDEADFAPLFMARGALREAKNPAGARADFERAVSLDGADWRARHALVNFHLRGDGAGDALTAARAAVERFPEDGPLRVDLVKSLMASGLYGEAAGILDGIKALPYEGASEIHGLFVQTQVRLALEKLRSHDFAAAVVHLDRSKEFPERLGTGAPFDPDVRLQDALAALCLDKLGDPAGAGARRKAVADFTLRTWPEPGPHAYFGGLVLRERGEREKAEILLAKERPAKEILEAMRLLGR